jgi:hypothetical protein
MSKRDPHVTPCNVCKLSIEGKPVVLPAFGDAPECSYHQECWDDYYRRLEAEWRERERRTAEEEATRCRIRLFDESFARSCCGAELGHKGDFGNSVGVDDGDNDGGIFAAGPLVFPKWA